MTEDQKEIAHVYARLTSVPFHDQMPKAEALEVYSKVLKSRWETFVFNPDETTSSTQKAGAFPRSNSSFASEVRKLSYFDFVGFMAVLHEHAQQIIVPLLKGEKVPSPLTPLWQLDSKKRTLQESWALKRDLILESEDDMPTRLATVVLHQLLALIKEDPFPFRQCPVCHKVFVPVKKQIYCSPNCLYTGVGGVRKKERREYMREYMREQRAEQKQQAAKKQRKTKNKQTVNT